MWNYSGLTRYRGALSVIVIILVAAALIGGGVWVQHRGEVARENGAQVATNKNKSGEDTSKLPVAPAGTNKSEVSVKQSSSNSSSKNSSSSSSKSTTYQLQVAQLRVQVSQQVACLIPAQPTYQ